MPVAVPGEETLLMMLALVLAGGKAVVPVAVAGGEGRLWLLLVLAVPVLAVVVGG